VVANPESPQRPKNRSRLADRQAILYEVLRVASGDLDPSHIAEAAAHVISERTGWVNVEISLPRPDGHWEIHLAAHTGADLSSQRVEDGVTGRAFRTGETQRVSDVSKDQDYVSASPEVQSELAVPLLHKGRRLGVLNLEALAPDDFEPDDVRLAESVAEVVALALENARLYREAVTERARLEAVVQSSRDGILLLSPDQKILVANERAAGFLGGHVPREALVGRPFGAVLRSFPAKEADELRKAAAEAGDPTDSGLTELPWVALSWLSLPVPGVGRLIVLRDVTDERRVERMREDLTRTMVHDLRSPLSSAMGFLGLLELDERAAPGRQAMLDIAKKGMTRVLALIDGILEIDRFEAGALPLRQESTDIQGVVGEVVALMEPLFKTADVPLTISLAPELPKVYADPQILIRVLQNLLENALKFSPRRTPVELDVQRGRGSGLVVSVKDQGPGVAPEMRSRLFMKFARGLEPQQGSGLGLAFCRLAVEAHGGRIWADRPETGARFVFTIPGRPGEAP
jgi:signal transduction histidine kinase